MEDRRLLAAGPRLAGVQPNNSVSFSFDDPTANVRPVAPRELNIRFDEDQRIDATTLDAIRITRSGFDGIFGNSNDELITPGFIGVTAAPDENEVVVRFAETLPDDLYRVEIFGAGSTTPLKNLRNENFVPTLNDGDGDSTKDSIQFELDLGTRVIAVVPQPVTRLDTGALSQARNQIEVYFNDDDLFVENDDLGNPTARSAENPNFYQLIFTADTVRNTDDIVVKPIDVAYDASNDRAVLTFARNLDMLQDPNTGTVIGPGTFRLRIGNTEATPLAPLQLAPTVTASSDFNTNDEVVLQFTAVRPAEPDISIFVSATALGERIAGAPAVRVNVVANAVFLDLNSQSGQEATAQEVIDAINSHAVVGKFIAASINDGNALAKLGNRAINYSPLRLTGMGSSFDTATDLSDDTDLGATLVITGSGTAFEDGSFFHITDALGQSRKFEFDSDEPSLVNDSASIRIPFTPSLSQAKIANAVANAINSASFGASAFVAGNQVRLEGDGFVDLGVGVSGLREQFQNKFDNGQLLEVTAGGNLFDELQTFSITDAQGNVQPFEFDSGYILEVPADISANLADSQTFAITDQTNSTVTFEFAEGTRTSGMLSATDGSLTVADVTSFPSTFPFNVSVGDEEVTVTSIVGNVLSITRGSNGTVAVAHPAGTVVSALGSRLAVMVIDEIETSLTVQDVFPFLATVPFNILVETEEMMVTQVTGNVFTVVRGVNGTTAAAHNADVLVDVVPAFNRIVFAKQDSPDGDTAARATATSILTAIQDAGLAGITPFDLGNARIHLGSNALALDTASSGLTQTGQPGAQALGAVPVPFRPHASFTAIDLARVIARAVNNNLTGVSATARGNQISFDGERSIEGLEQVAGLRETIQARFDAGPVMVVRAPNVSMLPDGSTILIRDDRGATHAFEIDRDAPADLNDPTARRIALDGTEDVEQIAQKIADAINASASRLEAVARGDRIHLTNDRDVRIDTQATALEATSQSLIISSEISARPYLLDLPGGSDEPGHRDFPAEVGQGIEEHINPKFGNNGNDETPGVTTILYNFQPVYGVDSQDVPLSNAITEQQKFRAREAFQLWGNYLGVQFLETARDGLTMVTGDLNVLNPFLPEVLEFTTNDFRVRTDPQFANGMLVMDSAVQWNEDFGGDWFLNAMTGIGSMLGLGLANDLPRSTLMARFTAPLDPITQQPTPFFNVPDPEPIFPGNADIVHGQRLFRPDGVDIDLYRFTMDVKAGGVGDFTAETFAERLSNSSLLDTVLKLYRENSDGTRELIAQNDDYFSRDSQISMRLGAGVYYIGVSASGNTEYDPTIDGTGFGGTSQGAYDLRLNFRAQVDREDAIRDVDGQPTRLDGDADGVEGGVYNFWFQTRPLNRVLEITDDGSRIVDGQVLTVTNSLGLVKRFEFDSNNSIAPGNRPVPFNNLTTAVQLASTLASVITGSGLSVNASALGERVTLVGERSLSLSSGFVGMEIHGKTIFVDKTAGPFADGSLGKPFNNISRSSRTNAFSATHPGDIVRIVGNGGSDEDVDTIEDSFAYEIGFGTLPGQILEDGTEMAVPRGVTVMVEPGTVFKMRRSRIAVGSSSLTVDRSGGALQVLGTPERNVFFTSWLDESIGRDTHPPTTIPGPGDWGGIKFQADNDNAELRPNLEEEGIFLNYVNHADIRYGGGGNVVIDSIQQIVNPIQMVETRPTISFNKIINSADSAMSATPDSFDETNFLAPRFQADGRFTSDYERVGPDIHANLLLNNSTNGLFIRIETPAGGARRPLTVSGRFDDTDIVHVLAENLIIQGSPGEPFLDLEKPAVELITFSPRGGGSLAPGTYNYKITFVDVNGFEGRPSEPTVDFTITDPSDGVPLATDGSAIQLNQLPPATGDFVRRRIYRRDDSAGGVYRLVAEIDASSTFFVDDGSALSAVLQRDPPDAQPITLTASPRGSLAAGIYNYRIVFVDARGQEGASSDPTVDIPLAGAPSESGIVLNNLPRAEGQFVARRIYRSRAGGISPYTLVAEIDATSTTYIDDGFTTGGTLDSSSFGVIRARPHARLAIDPGTIVKLEGARIETKFGAQFIAEGVDGQEVIFTSRLDDSFGAGGTFDTNNDDSRTRGEQTPLPGNWSGLFFGNLSQASIDHALIAFGGGISKIEGTFAGFNVIEVHQADLRLTNSVIENNAEGVGGQGPLDRFGRGYNLPATIFVRGAQPIILDNVIRDNNTRYDPSKSAAKLQLPVVTINANSLISDMVVDAGRQTGAIDRITRYADNQGPLVRGNRLDNNALNAMVVRGEELTTESVWDDTDIVHVLTNQFDQQDTRNGNRKWSFDEIVIPEFHTFGGLRLESSLTESLVVKLLGSGVLNNNVNLVDDGAISNRNAYEGAGFTASGRRFEIEDRVGGTLHVLGQPGFPVVLTSLNDDTVGAGVRPDDSPQTDTNNNGIATVPRPNDWRSVRLDQNSNDRNVDIVMEMEPLAATAPGLNGTVNTSQVLGTLADSEQSGDENLRMGFTINGFLNEPGDLDYYSFQGTAGTEVWFDIDRTSNTLDTIVELLDADGNVLARSNDAIDEVSQGQVDFISDSRPDLVAEPLRKFSNETHESGLYKDFQTTNPRDAGMRVALPGVVGTTSVYHLRVRSNDGLTTGNYQLQVRARERDEFAGSTVRFADIRYANNGVEVIGLPAHSPLLGEAAEDEEAGEYASYFSSEFNGNFFGPRWNFASNDTFVRDFIVPGNRPQDVGNLLESDRAAISIAGTVNNPNDVDFYQFDVIYQGIDERNRGEQFAATTLDIDYADAQVRFNSTLGVYDQAGALILIGRDSNVAEDRPGPLQGSDLRDLSRGTVGPKDPFIGPVELPEGQYYATVLSNSLIPSELDQFTSATPNNPLVRLEPLNSLVRIAEDHVDFSGGSTAAPPIVPQLIDPTGGTGLWHVTSNRANDPGHGLTNATGLLAASVAQQTLAGSGTAGGAQSVQSLSVDPDDSLDVVPDRLLIRFDEDLKENERDALLQDAGAILLDTFEFANVAVVGLPPGADVIQSAAHWSLKAGIEFADPDYVLRADLIPNDPSFSQMYGLNNTGQTGGTPDADIDAPEAWDMTTGSSNVVVAVIDSGVNYLHPDLAANMWQNPGEVPGDGIDNDGNGYVDDVYGIDTINNDSDPADDFGHGTHVAGTVSAVGDNATGVTGVSWNSQIMALKFLDATGGGTTSAAIEAIDYMTMMKTNFGVNILVSNNSWGGGGFSTALQSSIDASIQAGILFVSAAGNFGIDVDVIPIYPGSYNLPGILNVAATDDNDQLAGFSNYGQASVDIAAPGVDILSTMLTAGPISNPTGYGAISGTSMASPHVAGVAALIAAQQAGASPLSIKTAILAGGDRLSNLRGFVLTGARLNAANSLSVNTGGDSFYFGDEAAGNTVPDDAAGSLTSNAFPLKGYSAADLPTLYFNYYLNSSPADVFNVVVVESNGAETIVATNSTSETGNAELLFQGRSSTWRQVRIDLSPFAGEEGLKLRFDYEDNSPGSLNEGVYVDDLVIGFAERGEIVTGAVSSSQFIANPDVVPGEIAQGDYQLEIRSATDFASYDPVLDRQVLNKSFDTNNRFTLQTTLVAPAGDQVMDGQTFTVSDGVNEVTFEYQDPEFGGGVVAGNVEIRFKSFVGGGWVFDRDFEIARRIRDSINSAQVQTTLNITAASSDGEVSGTASTSNQVNLFGSAVVARLDPFSITETTTDANRLRDVILGEGIRVPASSRNATFAGSGLSAGLFVGGGGLLGLESGIVLSTGDVNVAVGPNTNGSSSGRASGRGDARLDSAFGVTTTDTSVLEFDFELDPNLPGGVNDMVLNFVFASEEYNEGIDGPMSDLFAIFVNDIDITDDIVQVSGADAPISINSINSGNPFDPTGATGDNPSLYRNNDPRDGGGFLNEFGYDGFTAAMRAPLLNVTDLGAGPYRIMIAVADVGDAAGDTAVFIEAGSFIAYDQDTEPDKQFVPSPQGIDSILHDAKGDPNLERPQGVVQIHSNTISDSKDFGIVADAGVRDTDGQVANLSTLFLQVVNAPLSALGDGWRPTGPESGTGPVFYQGAITYLSTPDVTDFIDFNTGGFSTDFAKNLTPVRLQNPSPGPARNLVVENLPEEGGFAPGVIIANNTIQNEGLGGIHVSGQSRTFEIMPQRPPLFNTSGEPIYPLQFEPNYTAGDMVNDGNLLIITAFGQTVTFEFEDTSGSPVSSPNRWATTGSGVVGGDGYDEGHIPIFYRRTNPGNVGVHPTIRQNRATTWEGYNQIEMAWAIKDAIDSSPLVSNDSTLSVQAQVAWGRHPGGDDVFGIHGLPGPGPLGQDPVVYLESVSNVEEVNRGGCTSSLSVPTPGCVVFVDRPLSIAVGAEP
ncbi:MAG: S8 family serine peptidase, partial [Pirellulaceae bacterium]